MKQNKNWTKRRFPLLKLLVVILVCSSFAGCAKPSIKKVPTTEVGSKDGYNILIDKSKALMNKRQFMRAIETLQKISNLYPADPEAAFLLGKSYFRIEKYDKAILAYEESLSRDKNYYKALTGLWAAKLEMGGSSKELKDIIRKEIETLLKDRRDTPGLSLAAYEGYYFIKDRMKRIQLIKELARNVKDEKLKKNISSYLSRDLITEKDPEQRIELADTYIKNFPHGRGMNVAAWILFAVIIEDLKDESRFLQYADDYLKLSQDNQFVNYAISYWLIEKDLDLKRAIHLLKKNLKLIKNPSFNKRPEHFLKELWMESLKRRKAFYYGHLGWAFYKQGKKLKAKGYLKKATNLYELSDKLYYRFGKVLSEKSNKKKAIRSLKRSLEINDSNNDAENLLGKLLEEEYGFKGTPRQFFAKEKGAPAFSDITEEAGLAAVKGMRVAWGDYNNDGYEDLLLDGPRLFKNLKNGTFINVTELAGLGGLNGYNGGIWGDFNNDGYLDIYLTSKKGNLLIQNISGLYFNDVTLKTFGSLPPEPTEAAAWGDFNNDGFLDLYVANMERAGVERALCSRDHLWKNEGGTKFQDVTEVVGVKSDEGMCGRGVIWGDFNNDGFSDIMVSNYRLNPNFLWQNNGNSSFTDVSEERGVQGREVKKSFGHTIGSVFGDIDNDGDLDLFSANLAHPRYIDLSDKSMVLINSGSHAYNFLNTFKESGITYAETHADPSFGDVDNDGDLDLYVTSIYADRNSFLYINDGEGKFSDVSWLSGTRVKNGWGSAFADIDNDGKLDLIVASSDGIHLFKNNSHDNHWLTVKIRSSTCNSFGVGSRVTINYNGKEQFREVRAGKGTGTQNSIPVEFGLGSYNGQVDIKVQSGCGRIVKSRVEAPDQIITIWD